MKIFHKFLKPTMNSFTIISNIKNFNPKKDTSIKIINEVLHFKEPLKKNTNNDYIIYQALNKSFFCNFGIRVFSFFAYSSSIYFLWKYLKKYFPNSKIMFSLFIVLSSFLIYFVLLKPKIKINKLLKRIILRKNLKTLEIEFFANFKKVVDNDKVYLNSLFLKYSDPEYKGNTIYWRINDKDYVLPIDYFKITDYNIFFSVIHGYNLAFEFDKIDNLDRESNKL